MFIGTMYSSLVPKFECTQSRRTLEYTPMHAHTWHDEAQNIWFSLIWSPADIVDAVISSGWWRLNRSHRSDLNSTFIKAGAILVVFCEVPNQRQVNGDRKLRSRCYWSPATWVVSVWSGGVSVTRWYWSLRTWRWRSVGQRGLSERKSGDFEMAC